MDSNQKRFVEDALDLLNELDEGLLQLEANPQASAPLEQVFRTMHTIKGGANMFGFENIGTLAHHLETLYDLVRQGSMQISDGLISITLQAFDKVRDLLNEKEAAKLANSLDLENHTQAAIQFLQLNGPATSGSSTGVINQAKEEVATYYIRISPSIGITPDGTHPLVFIVQDLIALGTSRVIVHRKENGEVLCWDICLYTATAQAELESYFIFVDMECSVSITRLSGSNLFEQQGFEELLNQVSEKPVGEDWIKSLEIKFATTNDQATDQSVEEAGKRKNKTHNDSYIKVSKRKVDDLLNWISELIILQAQLTTSVSPLQNIQLTEVTEQLEMVIGRLRDTSLEIGLVPVETLVTRFKRLVRDLSKSLNKKVNFLSEGVETEMDKDLIEMMTEPMMHIIRNAIDHGIETPGERKLAGKPEYGALKLKAFNSSSYVNLIISDDGKGIDKKRVLAKAIASGIVSGDYILSDEDILNLIFHPGLSTADKLSDVSGRGVGMDVVKQKINDLRGYATISSTEGKGTSIHIKLPLSRSIIEGLLVRVDDTRYVVPLNVIDRIDRVAYDVLSREDNVNKMVIINEEPLSVFSLRKKFHSEVNLPKTTDIVSVTVNGLKKGIAVDRIEGKMQTVMKPLGEAYYHQDFIAGSTILGDGSLALVLDPSRLFQLSDN
jgi:two-component system chemotaxis sensor kinase CheA